MITVFKKIFYKITYLFPYLEKIQKIPFQFRVNVIIILLRHFGHEKFIQTLYQIFKILQSFHTFVKSLFFVLILKSYSRHATVINNQLVCNFYFVIKILFNVLFFLFRIEKIVKLFKKLSIQLVAMTFLFLFAKMKIYSIAVEIEVILELGYPVNFKWLFQFIVIMKFFEKKVELKFFFSIR